MATSSKTYLWLSVAVILILGAFFLTQKSATPVSSEDNLFPERSLSHGHGLAVDVKDPEKLWIATHHGLLLLKNEKDLFRVGKSRDDYMGFSVHPTNSSVFFTSGHPTRGGNFGFQRSDDGGVTWKKVSDGVGGPVDFHAMTVSPVNPDIVYGWYAGNLQRSEDQGENWEIVYSEIVASYLAADPQKESRLYAASPQGEGVLVSEDKGETWKPLSPALEAGIVSVIAVHPEDSDTLLVFSEKLGGLGKSNDGGETWSLADEDFGRETVLHIAFSRIDATIVYALTHGNKIFKSTDSGTTWTQVHYLK